MTSFTTNPCGDGWEVVVEDTGRPVTRPRPTHQSAAATATILNNAAKTSSRALARALGCVEANESDFMAVRF